MRWSFPGFSDCWWGFGWGVVVFLFAMSVCCWVRSDGIGDESWHGCIMKCNIVFVVVYHFEYSSIVSTSLMPIFKNRLLTMCNFMKVIL